MQQDIENGRIDTTVSQYYLECLNATEDMLIYHAYTLHITDEKQ